MQKENKIKKFLLKTFFILGIFFLFSFSVSASTIEFYSVKKTLTNTELNSMFTTPVTLIPAPGANQFIIIESSAYNFVYTAPAYTGGGTNIIIRYNTCNSSATTAYPSTNLKSVTSSFRTYLQSALNITTSCMGKAVEITGQTANFATGNGTLEVFLTYYLLDLSSGVDENLQFSDPVADNVTNVAGVSSELEWLIEFMSLYVLFISVLLLVFWLGKKLI